MLPLEEKSQVMDIGVQRFFSKFEVLHKKGIHGLLVLNDKLITLSNYKKKMSTVAKDSSKFGGIQRILIALLNGEILYTRENYFS
jgi:hypothetical protein